MAKVRDSKGHEIEGQVVATEGQTRAREELEAKKVLKQEAVLSRQEARAARGPKEQLAALDKRLGKGQGAVRERTRLLGEYARLIAKTQG